MFEVKVAEVGPPAAVNVTRDVVKPVGIPRYARGLSVRRGPPVVSPVWGAAADRVPRHNQSAGAVVATLLPRAMPGTENTGTKHLKVNFSATF